MRTELSGSCLIVRADASPQIGFGHLMRCLGLAQAWTRAGGEAILGIATHSPHIEERVRGDGIEIVDLSCTPGSERDADKTARLGHRRAADWIVLDGYHFGSGYQRTIKKRGFPLLVFDDNGDSDHYWADLVVNQNAHASIRLYTSREAHTRLLLGTRYVILRPEFLPWSAWRRHPSPAANRVLVTLGGADLGNITLKALRALNSVNVEDLKARVVVGPGNPHYRQLLAAAEECSYDITLENDVSNMPQLMAWAETGIAATGITSWELAYMQVPALITVTATNQWGAARELHQRGIFRLLGWGQDLSEDALAEALEELIFDPKARTQMCTRGRELVDGKGAGRVLRAMLSANSQ